MAKRGRPSKGPRNVVFTRIAPAMHAELKRLAAERGVTINDLVTEALQRQLSPDTRKEATAA